MRCGIGGTPMLLVRRFVVAFTSCFASIHVISTKLVSCEMYPVRWAHVFWQTAQARFAHDCQLCSLQSGKLVCLTTLACCQRHVSHSSHCESQLALLGFWASVLQGMHVFRTILVPFMLTEQHVFRWWSQGPQARALH